MAGANADVVAKMTNAYNIVKAQNKPRSRSTTTRAAGLNHSK